MSTLDEVKLPLIAILRGITVAETAAVGQVLLDGGIEIVEVTMNSPDPLGSLQVLQEVCGESMLVGCGTVTSVAEVDKIADLGGGLIVSPNFNPDVVRATKARGLISAPGCLTASEIFAALEAGADVIKLFPGNIATPAVVKAYKAVTSPGTRFVVTGGVDETTIPLYKEVGVFGLGLGSNLYSAGKSATAVAEALAKFVTAYQA